MLSIDNGGTLLVLNSLGVLLGLTVVKVMLPVRVKCALVFAILYYMGYVLVKTLSCGLWQSFDYPVVLLRLLTIVVSRIFL